jgi:hypothetical protein
LASANGLQVVGAHIAAPPVSAARLGCFTAREILDRPTGRVRRGLGFLSCAGTVTSLYFCGLRAACGFVGNRTLRGHLFSRFLVISSFCGSSSSRGSFHSRFFRVSIMVNTTGVRVNIFLSRNQEENIERFGFEETKYERK